MLSFTYSSTQGPSNNLPLPTLMTAASSISVTSDEITLVLQLFLVLKFAHTAITYLLE